MKFQCILLSTALLFLFSGCEKIIQIKTGSSVPKMVIEGNISSEPGPYAVRLAMSTNYNNNDSFPAVHHAIIVISDDAGNRDTLKEEANGMYKTASISGVPGRTYTLYIMSGSAVYKAVSKMPPVTKIHKLKLDRSKFAIDASDSLDVNCIFQDPAAIGNYYCFVQHYNGGLVNGVSVISDKMYNGNMFKYPIPHGSKYILKKGDHIDVELRSIDEPVFKFYNTLNSITSDLGGRNTSPANPVNNIKGGALGYFSAYSVFRKAIDVP